LVDRIGSFEDAINRVIELSQYKKETNAGGNGSQANTNNQNQKVMSKQYLKIQKALSYEEGLELEADGSRTFSPDEMEAVENALAENSTGELQNQLDRSNLDLQQANQVVSERDETIATLNQTIADLKGSSAGSSSKVVASSDGGVEKPGPVVKETDSIVDAIDKVAQEYLG